MKKILITVLVLSTLHGFAQKKAKPDAFAKTITPQDLRSRLYIVAGPEMEGRETATPGQRKAAAYIESQFRSMGLQPGNNGSYQLYYDVYQDSLVDAGLEVNGQRFQMDRDFNASSANINATMKFSEVVFVGANATDSIKNTNLSGRVVMLIGSMPQGRGQMGGVLGTLYSKGVAAILSVASSYPRTTPAARKGNQILTSFRRNILPQQFTISENVARAIAGNDFDDVKSNPTAVKIYTANVTLDVQKTTITTQSSNVIAVLPG